MYCHILRVRAIPTLESTDSMIMTQAERALVEISGDLEEWCGYELAGKFPTNLKQELKKHHLLQYSGELRNGSIDLRYTENTRKY